MPPTPQVGTPSSTTLATSLTSSSAITGASFALGVPKDPQDVVSSKSTKTGFGGVAPQRIIYGTRGQIGGQCTYVTTSETTGIQEALGVPASDNGNIHMVITMAGHQISQFYGATVTSQNGHQAAVPLVIYFNGYQVPLSVNAEPLFGGDYGDWAAPTDGAYYVPADYFPPNLANGKTDTAHDFRWRIRVEIDLGDPTNSSQPFPLLNTDTVTGNPGGWSSTCLQQGCAKAHVQLIWDSTRFPNGVPNVTFDIAGKLIYDPRLSPPGLTFSENSALVCRDWLTDAKFGLAVDPSLINDDLVIAAANICDEQMALREGGTQNRYTCAGVFDADMERGQVLQKILDSMAGILIPPTDQWKMYAGAYRDSVLSITDADLRGPIKYDTAVSKRDICNAVKGTFISPDNNWQAADYPPYVNSTYVVDDGGTATIVSGHYSYTGLIFQDLTLDCVTDPIQAQRLAKIKVEMVRRKNPLVLQCKPMAFPVEAGDTITFTHERWGIDAATYLVTNTGLVADTKGDAPVVGYDLVCLPWDSTVFEWDPDVDEGTVEIVTAPFLPDDPNVGPPLGIGSPPVLGLESDASTTITRADGVAHSQILVTWNPPTDAHVLDGGYIEIFIKEYSQPDSDYLMAGSVAGNITSFYIDTNITDGVEYTVMVQSLNAAGSHSDPLTGSVVCSGSASSIIGGNAPGPVNVYNNDFEASDALPPVNWTEYGSPTLSYDISAQQQGIRSLVVTTSHQGDGVYTTPKYSVVPGDTYTGESFKVGGYIRGDGTSHGIVAMRFFDATDTEVGSAIIADGGSPTPAEWAFDSEVALVPNEAVYGRIFLQNDTPTQSPPVETSVAFDSIVLFRVASLEDEVANGPSRGAVTAANASYRPLTNPLTAVDDGLVGSPPVGECEIDIAAFTMRVAMEVNGGHDVSINSGVITGLGYQITYHVYYDDPTYAGGAVTYYCNTDQAVALDASGRFYVGSIKTPPPGGVPTVGNNDGGTGAQSGILEWLSPTLRADLDAESGAALWSPAFAEDTDGDTGTYTTVLVPDTIWLGGWPTIYNKYTSIVMKVLSEVVDIDNGGIAFCDYSLDDGNSWTNIFNVSNGSQDQGTADAGANSGSGTSWTAPANVADPVNYASITGAAHSTTSKWIQATVFGFSIPAGSTIDGIIAQFDQNISGTAVDAGEAPTFNVQLLKAGTPTGVIKAVVGSTTVLTPQLGDDDDLWSASWSASDINASTFGFQIQAMTPAAAGAWQPDTYYSPMALIIDSNNNLQQVVTPGVTGTSHPTWATSLSGTTADTGGSPPTLVWVCVQLHTTMTWTAGMDIAGSDINSWYEIDPTKPPFGSNPTTFVKATAAGTPCLFELTPGSMPRLGNLTAYTFAYPSNVKGSCNISYPAGNPPAAATGSFVPLSLHWTSPYNGSSYEFSEYVINGDGSLGSTEDIGHAQNWQCAIVGQLFFPKKGVYNFNMQHDDGMLIAMDTTQCKVTYCPRGVGNAYQGPKAPVTGYPWIAGSNASTTYSSGSYTPYDVWGEYFSISVNEDNAVIGFEIAYNNWEHDGHMILLCQDAQGNWNDIVPLSTDLKTGTTAPNWPAWSTAYAPNWPSVAEAGGNLVWINRGPASDFTWVANTEYTAAQTKIEDANANNQTAYRAGLSGSTIPVSFSKTLNGLTANGASLTWIEIGPGTALTYFNENVRNAVMLVSYVPPTASSSRAKTTDEITLPLNQNLGQVQVRYGLDEQNGDFEMYEVWIEGQAG